VNCQFDADRIRLREEHARVEAMHAALKTETDILRSDIARERQRLREERSEFESQKRDLTQKLIQSREQADVRLLCVYVCLYVFSFLVYMRFAGWCVQACVYVCVFIVWYPVFLGGFPSMTIRFVLQAERAEADMERRELERTRASMTKSIDREVSEVKKEADRQKVEAAALDRDRSVFSEKVSVRLCHQHYYREVSTDLIVLAVLLDVVCSYLHSPGIASSFLQISALLLWIGNSWLRTNADSMKLQTPSPSK
jgi:hypothetical protein